MQPKLFGEPAELSSQAAMLCQFFAWADPSHISNIFLRNFGDEFLMMILRRGNAQSSTWHTSVETGVRRDGIGVWAVLDGKLPILVEDKLGPISHVGHLERSRAKAKGWGYEVEPLGVYVQTVEEIPYEVLRTAGYGIVTRRALLGLLRFDNGQMAMEECEGLREFAGLLESLEAEARSPKGGD